MVMLDVLHPVTILAIVAPLVLGLPAALGELEERPAAQSGEGEVGEPVGLDESPVALVLTMPHDPDRGPRPSSPRIKNRRHPRLRHRPLRART